MPDPRRPLHSIEFALTCGSEALFISDPGKVSHQHVAVFSLKRTDRRRTLHESRAEAIEDSLPTNRHWRLGALCRMVDPTTFFHPDNERGPQRRNRINRAKKFCEGCTVLCECRDYALAEREAFGIWGGLSEEDRAQLLVARQAN